MIRRVIAILLLCVTSVNASPHLAIYTAPTGGTFYAYPTSEALTGWTTHRVQLVEGDGGLYSGIVDDASGLSWFVFSGASQPGDWSGNVASILLADLTLSTFDPTADEVTTDDASRTASKNTAQEISDAMQATPGGAPQAESPMAYLIDAAGSAATAAAQASDAATQSGTNSTMIDTLLTRLSAPRALLMDQWDKDTPGTLGENIVDTAATVETNLDAQVSGIEGGTVTETRDLEPTQHTFTLRRTGANALQSIPSTKLTLTQGDTDIRVAFDCDIPLILPVGSVLGIMTDPTSSNEKVVVTKLGIDGLRAKIKVDIAADCPAGEHTVSTTVTNNLGGGPIAITGTVVVREAE